MKKTVLTAALLAAAWHTASAEEWKCQLTEDAGRKTSFDYAIILDGAPTARVEVSPMNLGTSTLDDFAAGTSELIILRNNADGLALAAGTTGPTQYGRGVYGELLVIDRHTGAAVHTFAMSAAKMAYANPARLGNCALR